MAPPSRVKHSTTEPLHSHSSMINKYYIPERVIVKNIILRNMIINLGCALVGNHIPWVDIIQLLTYVEMDMYCY